MAKYGAGDAVFVRRDLEEDTVYLTEAGDDGTSVYQTMLQWAGKMVTISREKDGLYRIGEDKEIYCWTDEMFDDEATHLRNFLENRTIEEIIDVEVIENELFMSVKLDNDEILLCYEWGYLANDDSERKQFVKKFNDFIRSREKRIMTNCWMHVVNNRLCLQANMSGIVIDILLMPR